MLFPIALGVIALAGSLGVSHAHGVGAPELPPGASWAARHMAEEHHITEFTAPTFFKIHDLYSAGSWSPQTVERIYGLRHESNAHVPANKIAHIIASVFGLYDENKDGAITEEEYVKGVSQGKELPDFGTGPGHHGDDEYEYEIHHWEKHHKEGETIEQERAHQEDLDHFKKEEEKENAEAALLAALLTGKVLDHNVPQMFRVQ